MTPLEQQVCSLELSKTLKALGVKQDSLFYWLVEPWGYTVVPLSSRTFESKYYSAFTLSELLWILKSTDIPAIADFNCSINITASYDKTNTLSMYAKEIMRLVP